MIIRSEVASTPSAIQRERAGGREGDEGGREGEEGMVSPVRW
jgi:hypothetical protein